MVHFRNYLKVILSFAFLNGFSGCFLLLKYILFSPIVHENVHNSLPMLHIKITIQNVLKSHYTLATKYD